MITFAPVADIKLTELRHLREKRFLSQRALALRAGVSQQTIVRLEAGNGTPAWKTINALADALGVPPSELIAPE